MDGRGVITIARHRNETVEAVDGFYIVAGHNPGVHGAILTEALASRFDVHIEVTTDWDLARHLGVPAAAVTRRRRPQPRTGRRHGSAGRRSCASCSASPASAKPSACAAAVANLAGRAPEADRDRGHRRPAAGTSAPTVTALTLGKQR